VYIIVVGAGIAGFRIASLLTREGHDVAVIEQSESSLEQISRQLDVRTVLGSGVTPSVLREAGVDKANLLIAATNSDDTNLIACFLAKELGAEKTVARVRNPGYADYVVSTAGVADEGRRLTRSGSLGIDLIVNPDIITAEDIAAILSTRYSSEVYEFAHNRVRIGDFVVQNLTIADRPLERLTLPRPGTVVAVVRSDDTILPKPNTTIKLGDHVYVAAASGDLDEIGSFISVPMRPARNVVILGGGHVGVHLAGVLEQRDDQVKIIEPDPDVCQEVAQKLKRATIIQSDGTDRASLIEEGVPSADAFVAATGQDEINILTGLLAKNLGVPRCLAVVNNPGYISLAEGLGIDVALSPPLLAAGKIVRFVSHATIETAALLAGDRIMAMEFVVGPKARIRKDKLGRIGLPRESQIAALVRNHTVIIPQPDSVIETDDHVLAVCTPSDCRALEEWFG
jgi:trk system potassium uptake protein